MWAILKSWITGNIVRLIGFTAAALSVAAVLFGARQAGRNAERLEELKRIVEIKDAQLRAANNAPRNRDELVNRLQRGKF